LRPDDFFIEPDPDLYLPDTQRRLDLDLLNRVRVGQREDHDDVEIAVALTRLLHDDLERFGTDSRNELSDEESRVGLRALRTVLDRLDLDDAEIPFRDYGTFYNYWIRKGAKGSWQARRDLLQEIFVPIEDRLAVLEDRSIASTLVDPITSHARTGWTAVDVEIGELRRHFQAARTPQDYRAVGLDCVAVTEALSAAAYDPDRHLRAGEEEPPVANTKQRLDRVIEDALPGSDNAALRKLGRAVIEMAQQIKHSTTPTRREAGIGADAVIQLANFLQRLEESE
jgi:hypothetical protein